MYDKIYEIIFKIIRYLCYMLKIYILNILNHYK